MSDPDDWPIVARMADDYEPEDWRRYDMPVAEFLGRVRLEPGFRPFGVARWFPRPFFGSFPEDSG